MAMNNTKRERRFTAPLFSIAGVSIPAMLDSRGSDSTRLSKARNYISILLVAAPAGPSSLCAKYSARGILLELLVKRTNRDASGIRAHDKKLRRAYKIQHEGPSGACGIECQRRRAAGSQSARSERDRLRCAKAIGVIDIERAERPRRVRHQTAGAPDVELPNNIFFHGRRSCRVRSRQVDREAIQRTETYRSCLRLDHQAI